MSVQYDVCVRGAGVVGHCLALLMARDRLRVALVDQTHDPAQPRVSDVRAYALNAASRELLESLRAWPAPAHATPVTAMKVSAEPDGAIGFAASDLQRQALTWIVDVGPLLERLGQAVDFAPRITRVANPVAAHLTVVTEGRTSRTRAALGVEFAVQPYGQHAVAARLIAQHPHGGVAFQWFTGGDVVALLPMGGHGGHELALVWSMDSARATQMQQGDAAAFEQQVTAISHAALGSLTLDSPRMTWALQQAMADRWCGQDEAGTWVLAGDAAHAVHPLAGQGLNLGLGDARALAQVIHDRAYWRAVGDLRLLRQYERQRKAEVQPLMWGMDGLQRLFAHPAAPVAALRNWGLRQADRSTAFKRWAAGQAIGVPAGSAACDPAQAAHGAAAAHSGSPGTG